MSIVREVQEGLGFSIEVPTELAVLFAAAPDMLETLKMLYKRELLGNDGKAVRVIGDAIKLSDPEWKDTQDAINEAKGRYK